LIPLAAGLILIEDNHVEQSGLLIPLAAGLILIEDNHVEQSGL